MAQFQIPSRLAEQTIRRRQAAFASITGNIIAKAATMTVAVFPNAGATPHSADPNRSPRN
jgi:hypothetical protein